MKEYVFREYINEGVNTVEVRERVVPNNIVEQIKADAIEECIKTITDYCGGLPNSNLINALEQLKGAEE